MITVAPYGSWKSPITSSLITSTSIVFEDVWLDGDAVYWSERRPLEEGRYAIVRWSPYLANTDVLPMPFSARTRVHEYGGAAFAVVNETVFFNNDADQRVYRVDKASHPTPLTPGGDIRHADFTTDRRRLRLIAIQEDHSTGSAEAVNSIAEIRFDATGEQRGRILVQGNDFYASPRISPDGDRLAWLTWNHPNMPWDGCELWVGEVGVEGLVSNSVLIGGGPNESIVQPGWSPTGDLYFVSDRSGWWNLYRLTHGQISAVWPEEAEFGRPLSAFDTSTYGFVNEELVAAASVRNGTWRISLIDCGTGAVRPIRLPSTTVDHVHAGNGFVVFVASSPVEPASLVRLDVATGSIAILKASATVAIDRAYVSVPGAIEFPTTDGLTAHGFYYPPQNQDFAAPDDELPPLIVLSHGGPTSATSTELRLAYQYWTSRGFAILDVDYGGSTGYGRPYREKLNGQWGIVDVDDCVNGALHLVKEGLVDRDRLIIQGRSASGYTTLSALAFRDTFRAGVSFYGIGDLEAITRDTHKFESHYLDGLIGPYPESIDLYRERSAINFIDQISCPLLLFQGSEDMVVPPNQARMMYDAVEAKGLPVALVIFEGEQHGFRKAESIERSLDGELYFLSRVFGFPLATPVKPIPIANLPD